MTFWTPDNLKTISGGRWLARVPDGVRVEGVSTDSRSLTSGQVFLALKGDAFDGHAFLGQAAAAGAPLLVIDQEGVWAGVRADLPTAVGVLLVDDTARILLRFAQAYRQTLTRTKVIAVGGSNGKTTTVRMLDAVLGTRLRGRASAKSFNNSVGVPLTILGASPTDQYLICEVGTNAPGEIGALAPVVEPDICVLTSLGREHLEGLGSLDGVAREEASLIGSLREGGCAIVACDESLVTAVRAQLRALPGEPRVLVTFGREDTADVRVENAAQDFTGVTFTLNDRSAYSLPLLGLHNALNAAAAVAVARRLGLTTDEARTGLATVRGPAMRLEREEVVGSGAGAGGIRVINDAYNANPESVLAAFATLREVAACTPHHRRVVILGDMLEQGAQGPGLHAEVGRALAQGNPPDLVVLVGSLVAHTATVLRPLLPDGAIVHLPDVAAPRDAHVAGLLRPGDLVLLKASRGIGLERVLTALRAGAGGAPPPEPKPSGPLDGHKTPQPTRAV